MASLGECACFGLSIIEYCKKLLCGIVFFNVINKREALCCEAILSLVFMRRLVNWFIFKICTPTPNNMGKQDSM